MRIRRVGAHVDFVFRIPSTTEHRNQSTPSTSDARIMPRVKHEAHLVAVPAVLRLHPLWLSSPLLNSTCQEHGNCIPFQLYKQVFEKTDEIATRLSDLEGITSPSAVAAGTLCTNIQSAYHGLTGMHLYRANPSISRYRPAPARE